MDKEMMDMEPTPTIKTVINSLMKTSTFDGDGLKPEISTSVRDEIVQRLEAIPDNTIANKMIDVQLKAKDSYIVHLKGTIIYLEDLLVRIVRESKDL